MAAALGPVSLRAQTIDLGLNIFYDAPGDSTSGGTWEVVAKSSDSGISAIGLYITGIDDTNIVNRAPRSNVNGSDIAGFQMVVDVDPTFTEIGFYHGYLPAGTSEQPLFYGIGTLENGSPAFAGQDPDANTLGPTFTTLTNLVGAPWATGDAFGDADWATAATLVSGTFAPGQTPEFAVTPDGSAVGSVFTSVGTISSPGTRDQLATVDVSTVRTNLVDPFGDYNGDGFVDAADYTVWRDTLGMVVTPGTGADGNFTGIIDQGDYTIWRRLFGTTAMPAAVSGGAAVPEPGAKTLGFFTLLMIGAAFCRARMRAVGGGEPRPSENFQKNSAHRRNCLTVLN